MLETLKYIAKSPAQEHGGFHPNTVDAAKWAIAEISRLRKLELINGNPDAVADLVAACRKHRKEMRDSFCSNCEDDGNADCEGRWNEDIPCSLFVMSQALDKLGGA